MWRQISHCLPYRMPTNEFEFRERWLIWFAYVFFLAVLFIYLDQTCTENVLQDVIFSYRHCVSAIIGCQILAFSSLLTDLAKYSQSDDLRCTRETCQKTGLGLVSNPAPLTWIVGKVMVIVWKVHCDIWAAPGSSLESITNFRWYQYIFANILSATCYIRLQTSEIKTWGSCFDRCKHWRNVSFVISKFTWIEILDFFTKHLKASD